MAKKKYRNGRLAGDADKPISHLWKEIDNDLARDNLEKHLPAADLQDL